MVLLILFAFLAGIGTALSPCVLPVLPIALSAGATGGSRRPLGIVTGLALSFTFAAVALVYVIHALGLPDDLLRKLAIAALIGFGIALVIPAIGDRLEAWLSRLARRAPRGDGDAQSGGFASGVLVGVPLGLVYAPCAGPILAGVITLSASQTFTAGRLATALAYGIGSAVALYALMLGGRRVMRRLARHSGRLQQGLGVVMVVVAVLMLANLDTRFQNAIASDLPSFLVNPTGGLEKSGSVSDALDDVRGKRSRASTEDPDDLRRLFPAPPIQGTQRWFNTPGGGPLSLAELRRDRRVVLIDFWTYTCINCIRTLPQLKAWDEKYRADGLTIIGVHTPEFPFEKDAGNVEDAIHQEGLRYPVVQDNEFATWDAYANQYWPAKYLIDADGYVRYVHFGEGEYDTTERAIRALLAEAGTRPLGAKTDPKVTRAMPDATPETYLGSARAERFVTGQVVDGSRRYVAPGFELPPDHLAFGGRWRISPDGATAEQGARLLLNFKAKRVFLVLGSRGGTARRMRVLVDGKPVRTVTVKRQRLYPLVDLPRAGRHVLELRPQPGITGYAFTFG
jgi:cytochrome c biogenesis protein CcdA/thiol-disulfide isomerase/thioredoxin